MMRGTFEMCGSATWTGSRMLESLLQGGVR